MLCRSLPCRDLGCSSNSQRTSQVDTDHAAAKLVEGWVRRSASAALGVLTEENAAHSMLDSRNQPIGKPIVSAACCTAIVLDRQGDGLSRYVFAKSDFLAMGKCQCPAPGLVRLGLRSGRENSATNSYRIFFRGCYDRRGMRPCDRAKLQTAHKIW
jgi:hypothetical protein